MKPTSKMSVVASSPGRPEKLPAPPFSRLLKGKSGSRSRRSSSASHSRASPMFVVRRRSAPAGEVEGEKEPGSPKVTCIGQVRIYKKKNKMKGAALPSKEDYHHQQSATPTGRSSCCDCRCFHRPDFCNPFTKLPQPKRTRPPPPQQQGADNNHRRLWQGWFSSSKSHASERKQQKQLLHTPPATTVEEQQEAAHRTKPRVSFACSPVRRDWMSKVAADGNAPADDDDEGGSGGKDDLAPSTPPKNALLLMRCRSAPQGASPFTRRFAAPDEPATATAETDPDPPVGRSSPFFRFKLQDSSITARDGFRKSADVLESTSPGGHNNSNSNDDDDGTSSGDDDDGYTADEDAAAVGPSPSFSSVPLILTRCKSEPAHKAAKLQASAPPDSSNGLWTGAATDDNNNNNNRVYYNNIRAPLAKDD